MHNQFIIHTVLEAERQAFAHHVNEVLKQDKDLSDKIPTDTHKIFESIEDGVILCKLINAAVPGKVPPISPLAINVHPTNVYQKIENLNLAIESAKAIGCTVVNVHPQLIMQKREHIVLGLIWQIIKIHMQSIITLKKHPEIIVLKKEDQEDGAMQKLGYEEILIRWINYHIKKNGGDKKINNLGNDMIDGYAYGHVLKNVAPASFDSEYWNKNQDERAKSTIQTCKKQNITVKIRPDGITSGNPRLNTLLCVQIFNERHGLVIQQQKIVDLPPEAETDETRQIRIFKNWINSQGIEDVYVNYLMDDLRDGKTLLKVIDNLRPGIVDWKKFSNKLHSRIHIVQNCNYVVDICKGDLKCKLIGIGGLDLVDGSVTLTLGVVWQLCKTYWEERVGTIDQAKLVSWANEKVPEEHRIKNFKDKSIRNCMFLLNLINSIKPNSVDFSKVKEDDSEEEQIAKINYTVSAARKLGAQILALWEHVDEVNAKYVALFVAELENCSKKVK